MSLLTIISEVCGRLSLTIPATVVGNSDQQVTQLYYLTNKAGHDLAQSYNWQALTKTKTFTTVNATTQPNAVPSDFDRFIPNSFFNRTTRRPIIGPVTPQQWEWLVAQPAYSTVYLLYRQQGNAFLLGPPVTPPPAGQTIAFEYLSNQWANAAAGGAGQTKFLADGDTTVLDEALLADFVIWMFLRAKGLSYAEEMATFSRNLDQQQARDGGSTALHLTPTPINLDRVNLPDGSFGV